MPALQGRDARSRRAAAAWHKGSHEVPKRNNIRDVALLATGAWHARERRRRVLCWRAHRRREFGDGLSVAQRGGDGGNRQRHALFSATATDVHWHLQHTVDACVTG